MLRNLIFGDVPTEPKLQKKKKNLISSTELKSKSLRVLQFIIICNNCMIDY